MVASPASQEASEWRQATPERPLVFPADHASHPEYRVEWWYYTGHLDTKDGRRFGYQVTFFRVGIDREPKNSSRWAVRDLFMTHLAVTDVDRERHFVDERLNRAGVGWAGARTDRLEVWNEDWKLQSECGRPGTGISPAVIAASVSRCAWAKTAGRSCTAETALVRRGADSGNASHYYSLTRMPTEGQVTIGGEVLDVKGLSWMDHEFGSSFLEPSQERVGLVFVAARRRQRSDGLHASAGRSGCAPPIERHVGHS